MLPSGHSRFPFLSSCTKVSQLSVQVMEEENSDEEEDSDGGDMDVGPSIMDTTEVAVKRGRAYLSQNERLYDAEGIQNQQTIQWHPMTTTSAQITLKMERPQTITKQTERMQCRASTRFINQEMHCISTLSSILLFTESLEQLVPFTLV
jgi:hypothetical protein